MREGTLLATTGLLAPSGLWLSWVMAALLLRCLGLYFLSPFLLHRQVSGPGSSPAHLGLILTVHNYRDTVSK